MDWQPIETADYDIRDKGKVLLLCPSSDMIFAELM